MNNENIYLVITIISKDGKVQNVYHGEHETKNIPKVSYRDEDSLAVPLWFSSDKEATDYLEKANAEGTEREFYLIQEHTYKKEEKQDQAFLVFRVKSEFCPTLDEGDTERSPGVWAHVRSFFLCDKSAAEEYVSRFNKDAQKAFECKKDRRIA